ncbi:MAG: hypothetical protein D6781_04555 [Verrucomicrobia bacterium]|nr:MAG: hypothetical protein D6781_04555 [Verrucomicrobiota bacterium]
MSGDRRSSLLTPTISLTSLIVLLLAIPVTMEWLNIEHENVRMVGRICVGLAALLAIYGALARLLRVLILFVGIAITLTILQTEGLIDLIHS